jgi:hypothetical protein
MKNCPIVKHHERTPTVGDLDAVDNLAACIRRECPSLALQEDFQDLVPDRLDDAPTLHLDDLSEIAHFEVGRDARYYQERARLRAGNGDFVATGAPVAEGYESYCCEKLGLGSVHWLHARPAQNPLRIAEACWEDHRIRSLLVDSIRAGSLRYLHPHMGTFAVWELAALLRDASQRSVKVIAPPPRLSAWVNDKIVFAEVVSRLFGRDFVPRTLSAFNFAILADRVRKLASSSPTMGFKLPNAAGADGTIVLDGRTFVDKPLWLVREKLKQALSAIDWNGASELLVDHWETEIVCSPSAQLWIPPQEQGEPIVEGIFTQIVEGPTGIFVGSAPARLPGEVTEEIATRCWLLGRLFQRLGYVGRCSFDLILVGTSPTAARLEFIECNGRWGGTSAPMTLMNRLVGDAAGQPYVARVCDVAEPGRTSFLRLLKHVGPAAFDRARRTGELVFSMPGRLQACGAIDVVSLGTTIAEAEAHLKKFVENTKSI